MSEQIPVESTPAAPIESENNQEQLENQEESAEAKEASSDEQKLEELETKDVSKLSKSEKKELEKKLKKYKLKVDGKEEEMELDLDNEEEVKKHLQFSKAAQKRMQEKAELQKSVEQFIDLLRTNPRKVLSDPNINVDIKKFAQDILNEELENANKSPEQLEKEKLQKELEELKDKYKKDEEDRKSKEYQRLQQEAEQKLEGEISDALTSSELPKSPYTVRKMAEIMMLALQNDIDLGPKDVIPLLRKQMKEDISELFSASSDEVLEELIGKDNISRIRKRNIAKAKQAVDTANSVKSTGGENKPKDAQETKKISMKEFLGM